MKKVGIVLLTLAILLAAALLLTFRQVRLNRERMETRPPLTLEEVERIAADIAPKAEAPKAEAPPAPAPASAPGDPASAAPSPAKPAPRLKRALTREEALSLVHGRPDEKPTTGARLVFRMFETVATVYRAVGSQEAGGAYFEAASEAEAMRDPETARRYYEEALRHPLDDHYRQWCLSRLARYQKDPQVAERMIEAACATDNIVWLQEAVEIGEVTGSTELRDHYLERLRKAEADMAALVQESEIRAEIRKGQ